MESSNQPKNTQGHSEPIGKWIRLAIWYNGIPFLRRTDPFVFMALILGPMLALIFPKGGCPCSQQFIDAKLEAMNRQGHKKVIAYMQTVDNKVMCAAMRQELLKRLEKEKKQKPAFNCPYARKRVENRIEHERKGAVFTINPDSRAGLSGN